METLIRSNAIIPVGTKPIFIELCAGSAGLSLYVNAEGFRSIPVDHSRCDHKSKVPCVILDLSDPAQAQIIINLLRSGNVAAIQPSGEARTQLTCLNVDPTHPAQTTHGSVELGGCPLHVST